MGSPNSKSIAVLGAGITGLTAAHRLVERGHRVRVFEASDRVGGAIRSEHVDGWLIEAGPNSMLGGDPAVTALIEELGLANDRIAANPDARKRYIVRSGRALAAPLSPPAFLTSSLFSFGAKCRVLAEFRAKPKARTEDVSLEDFGREHFGSELVDYALNPFVAGIYAGNPKRLSTRYAFPKLWAAEQQHGSILRAQIAGAKKRPDKAKAGIFSFPRGLQTLTDALAQTLPAGSLALRTRVESLVPGPLWIVKSQCNDGVHSEEFDAVIVALPAPALAQLQIGRSVERPLASLGGIEHPPVSSFFLGFKREHVRHALDGFGVLVPEVERRSILGVLFSSTLFPGRAPADHVALTVIVGGTRQPEIARLPAASILEGIERDLREILGVSGQPVFLRHTFWPQAIPQYNLGYETHLATIETTEKNHPGLFVGGQARDGIALPACIAAGERLAQRILS